MPSKRTSVWLAFLVLVGLGYLFFFERNLESTAERLRRSSRVMHLTAESVTQVKIRKDAWTSTTIDRVDANVFRIVEPIPGAADTKLVSELLSALEFLDQRAVLENEGKDSKRRFEYGLDPPQIELEITTQNGKTHRLEVGNLAPLGGGVYVRANREGALVVVDQEIRAKSFGLLDKITNADADSIEGDTAK